MKRKKVLFHSNHCKAKTGFGRNAKTILKYLAQTGKYDIVEYSTSTRWGDPELDKLPWKTYGCLPLAAEWSQVQKDQALARSIQYGAKYIDEIIKTEKPDVYIGVEDIWAFNGWWNKKWWNNITPILHTTLDSLPIITAAEKAARKTENFFVWAKFAETEMRRLGHSNVKTVHGAFDTDDFFKVSDSDRAALRKRHGIPHNAFVVGFVFRNQLRKSVSQLIEGFKSFQESNPNAYLLLHTCWSEDPTGSWNIPKLVKESGIDKSRVLTTYVCVKCGGMHVKPFTGEKQDCTLCGTEKSANTASSARGVTESDLNLVYNLMDVYCHPFTSGGQEMPIQEAKLTELITLVTNYSCGEEYCGEDSGGLPLSWSPYREPHTQFIKATTHAKSITDRLKEVAAMSKEKKRELGKIARNFVIDNFDVSVIGGQWEEAIDAAPEVGWDFDFTEPDRNPNYIPSDQKDDILWLKELYSNILIMEVDDKDEGLKHWVDHLEKGTTREQILEHFKKVAKSENAKNNKVEFSSLLDKDDEGKRIAIVMPESAGDVLMTTSLLPSIKKLYPDHNIYFVTKTPFMSIVEGHPDVHKVLPWIKSCDNLLWMEGSWDNEGMFEVCYLPHVGTQRHLKYLHNGEDIIGLDIKSPNLRDRLI